VGFKKWDIFPCLNECKSESFHFINSVSSVQSPFVGVLNDVSKTAFNIEFMLSCRSKMRLASNSPQPVNESYGPSGFAAIALI